MFEDLWQEHTILTYQAPKLKMAHLSCPQGRKGDKMHDLCSATDYYLPMKILDADTCFKEILLGCPSSEPCDIRSQHRRWRWLKKIKAIRVKRALQFSELGRDMGMEMVWTQGSDTVQVSHK